MNRHMCHCAIPPKEFHTNAFVNIDGIPYLVADYLDRRNFQQIDRSMVNSSIETDQSEAMRAIIDINVDDIGKKSDGSLSVVGNNTKQINLLEMIKRNFSRLQNRLPVLRKGIILRVNYRLENHRTGQTIKSMVEDFRIGNANYFLDINPKNINDNGIVVNFSGSSASTINHFTHGRDRMILRITNVDLFYECVKNGPVRPVGKEYLAGTPDGALPTIYGNEDEMYEYQKDILDCNMPYQHRYGNEPVEMITPPSWILFNHFYHFDNNGKDIIIHHDEVYSRNLKVALVPCGSVVVNRAIVVNPCHRIIFKFCVWKNDTTLVNDTTMIAHALRASVRNPYYDNPSEIYPSGGIIDCGGYHDHHDHYKHPIIPDYETLLRMYQSGQSMDYDQNAVINQLNTLVAELTESINELKGNGNNEDDEPVKIPTLPEAPAEKPCRPRPPHHDHHDPIKEILCMIKSLQDQINDLKESGTPDDPDDGDNNEPSDENCGCGNNKYKPMQPDDIKDAVNGAMDETDPDKKED